MPGQRLPNRWLIACAGVIMNVCVGTTYALSRVHGNGALAE